MPKEEEIHSHIAINYWTEYDGTIFNGALNIDIKIWKNSEEIGNNR